MALILMARLLKKGGSPPRLCLYEKQFLTHASRIAANASRVIPYLGRSFLIMGKKVLMMYRVDEMKKPVAIRYAGNPMSE